MKELTQSKADSANKENDFLSRLRWRLRHTSTTARLGAPSDIVAGKKARIQYWILAAREVLPEQSLLK